MISVKEIEELAASSGGEKLNVEFKQSISWKNVDNQISIIRAVLGMSNIEGGGRIIIGVEQKSAGIMDSKGMTDSDYESYDKDNVKAIVANYADRHANVDVHHVTDGKKKFVVIDVGEFDEIPVVCKKSCDSTNEKKTLKAGKMYTRSHGVPGTPEVSTPEQLREIIELATNKGVAKFVKRASQAGMLSTPVLAVSDDTEFDREIAGL